MARDPGDLTIYPTETGYSVFWFSASGDVGQVVDYRDMPTFTDALQCVRAALAGDYRGCRFGPMVVPQ